MDRLRKLVLLLMVLVTALPAGGATGDRCAHGAAGHQSAPGSAHAMHAMTGHRDDHTPTAAHAGHDHAAHAGKGSALPGSTSAGDGSDATSCLVCAGHCNCTSCGATAALVDHIRVPARLFAPRLYAPAPSRPGDVVASAPFRPPIPV